jgi:hypothetical protein
MKKRLARFDDWWFGYRSPVALGLLRILLGFAAVISLGMTLFMFDDWYTPDGFVPRTLTEQFLRWDSHRVWANTPWEFHLPFGPPRLNLLAFTDNSALTLGLYLLTIASAVGFTLGWRTRWCGIVLVLGMISIHTRNPLIIHSGDTLLRLCLIYLVLSPSGAALSLDRRRELRQKGLPPDTPLEYVRVTGQRLIQYQTALVYLTTVWWKVFGTFWMDGTATFYPAMMHEFRRFPVPGFLERQPFIGLTTYGTLIVEVALGTLIFWKPARKWVVILGLLLHAYIEYRFNIPMFALIITTTYIAFYEGDEVERWLARRRWGRRLLGWPEPAESVAPAPA